MLKGGYNTALEVCSLLENPEEVFSKWRSCAFADACYGDFVIDDDIYVNDLLRIGKREAGCSGPKESRKLNGYIFGVTYYGEPVVADMLGRIRKVQFPKAICENCEPIEQFNSFAEMCDHFDEGCHNKRTKKDRARRGKEVSRWVFPWIPPTSSSDKSIISWFRRFKKKRFSEAGSIHIGAEHTLDVEYLFGLPTANLSVGSVRQDAKRYRRYENPIGPRNYYELV